jgi:uncharacterized membrane protein
MADDLSKGAPSTASIKGHPIHPMLVPFPIAFLVGTLATDLVFWGTGSIGPALQMSPTRMWN